MVTRTDIENEVGSTAEGILREDLCLSERPTIDVLKELLQQNLLPDIKNLMRVTLREEMPSLLRVFSQDSLRRELSDQFEVIADAIQRGMGEAKSLRKSKSDLSNSVRRQKTDLSQRSKSKGTTQHADSTDAQTTPTAALEVRNDGLKTDASDRDLPGAVQLVPSFSLGRTSVRRHSLGRNSSHETSSGRRKSGIFCLDSHAEDLVNPRKASLDAGQYNSITPDATDSTAPPPRRSRGLNAKHIAIMLVQDTRFDTIYGVLIMLNAVSMGVQTDVIAKSSSEITPVPLQICDMFFCVVFLVELILRLLAYRMEFFYMPGWHWNWFDLTLVTMQLFEETVALIARFDSSNEATGGGNLSFLRVLRVFRLLRLVRMARILRFVRQLRTLVQSISGSLQSLGWTVLLLVILIYTVAIYFTQAVSNHRHSLSGDALNTHAAKELQFYFGDLGRSSLSLFEATSGGIDWDNLASPLMTEISPYLCLIFTFYIAFVLLAMLNVVTGVFVENALQGSAQDKESQLVSQLKDLFELYDLDYSGTISMDEFETMLRSPANQQTFKSFDVKISQARSMFRLIDVEGSGSVDINAFIMGCLRLRGTARAADLTTLSYELQRAMVKWRGFAERIESSIAELAQVATSRQPKNEDDQSDGSRTVSKESRLQASK